MVCQLGSYTESSNKYSTTYSWLPCLRNDHAFRALLNVNLSRCAMLKGRIVSMSGP